MITKIQTLDKSSRADVKILFPETADQIMKILSSNKNVILQRFGHFHFAKLSLVKTPQ